MDEDLTAVGFVVGDCVYSVVFSDLGHVCFCESKPEQSFSLREVL